MAKGTYVVDEGADTSARDASYKSCMCALLVFIAICIIILLAGTKWAKDEIKREVDDEVKRLELEGNRETTLPTTVKFITERPTTTSTLHWIYQRLPTTTTTTPYPITFPTTSTTTTPYPITFPTTSTTTTPYPINVPTNPLRTATTTTTTTPYPITFPTTSTTTTPYPTNVPTTPTRTATTTTTTTSYPITGPITSTRATTTTTPYPITVPTTSTQATTTRTSTTTPKSTTTTTTATTSTTSSTTTPPFLITKLLNYLTTEKATVEKFEETRFTVLIPITSSTTVRTSTQNDSNSYEDLGKDIEISSAAPSPKTEMSSTSTERVADYAVRSTTPNGTMRSSTIVVEVIDDNVNRRTTKVASETTTDSIIRQTSNGTTVAEETSGFEYLLIRKSSTLSTVKEEAEVTTEAASEHETMEVPEVTNYESTYKEFPTDLTEPPGSPLVEIIKKSTILSSLRPTTASETTTDVVEGQQAVNYDYSEEDDGTVEIITAVNKPTTETQHTTVKMQPWHERTSPATNILPVLTKSEPVCLSVECKSAASRMLSFMNHSVDPCEDFYEFACGGMEADNADSDTWKRLSEQLHLINNTAPPYLRTFKMFYDSCVSYEYQFDYQQRIARVLELVKEVGEIYDGEPPSGSFDMTDLFAKLILRQSLPIMEVDVDIDKQSSKFILKLTLPRKTSILKESGRWSALSEGQKRCLDEQRHELQQRNLDLTMIHESYLTCQKNYAIYLNSIQTVVRALGFYSHLNDTYNQTQRIQDLRTTIEWDVLEYLNTLPPPNEARKVILFKNYTIMKVSDLQAHHPFLQWRQLFKILTGHEVEDSTLVQVYFRNYFSELFQGFQKTANWKVNNALVAMYANDLYENLVIPQARQNREIYCLKLSSKLFHDTSSNMYMKTWGKDELENSQKFLTNIFNILKRSFKMSLLGVDWIDDDSKVLMGSKVDKISLTFNKKEDLYNNETYLNLKYSNVNLNETDFQYNAVKMLETSRNMLYTIHGKPYSINYLWSYFLNAHDSTPTSFYSKVLIMAPLGMVKQPVKGFPGYITMARIGLSLAREIGRHFDPVGIHHGMTLFAESEPSYVGLMSTMESKDLFNLKRFVGQQDVSFEADSKLSANERIADNTGMRLISDVFNRSDFLLPWVSSAFKREKIFYITVAQEYCKKTDMSEYMQQLFETELLPASLRVENIMTNSDDFSKTFECPVGSAMNNNPLKTQFPYLEKLDDYYSEESEHISR